MKYPNPTKSQIDFPIISNIGHDQKIDLTSTQKAGLITSPPKYNNLFIKDFLKHTHP